VTDGVALLGRLAGRRTTVAETTFGRILTPPAARPARVVSVEELIRRGGR
jgi:hypothetical protein